MLERMQEIAKELKELTGHATLCKLECWQFAEPETTFTVSVFISEKVCELIKGTDLEECRVKAIEFYTKWRKEGEV